MHPSHPTSDAPRGGARPGDRGPGDRDARDAGLSLLELLVAAAVLSVLAAVAVPGHEVYVERARATAAASDARHAALLSEAAALESGAYADAVLPAAPGAALPADLLDFRASPGTTTRVWAVAAGPGGAPAGACVLSRHARTGTYALHDTSSGPVARGSTAADVPDLPASSPCARLAARWRAEVAPGA